MITCQLVGSMKSELRVSDYSVQVKSRQSRKQYNPPTLQLSLHEARPELF